MTQNTKNTTVLFIFDVRDELKEYLLAGLKELKNLHLIFPEDTSMETYLRYAPEAAILVHMLEQRPDELAGSFLAFITELIDFEMCFDEGPD